MERRLADVGEHRQERGQTPHIQRRVRMSPHIDHVAKKGVTRVIGVRRIDLRVLRAGKVINVVSLNRLIEKWQAYRQHDGEQEKGGFQAGFQRMIGLRAAVTSSTRLVRVKCGAVRTSSGSVSTSPATAIIASTR